MFFLRRAAVEVLAIAPPMQTSIANDSEFTGDLVVLALPLRRQPSSQHPFISIGRLEGNDIALMDATVSKFHAYINVNDGAFLLQDARSRNGTKVDGVPVAPRGSGPPSALADGQHIEVGSVTLSCVTVDSLLQIAAALVPKV